MLIAASLLIATALPDIVMTRREIERLTTPQLAATLLKGFLHGAIRSSRTDALPEFPDRPLDHVVFEEQGIPAEGRFCAARRILVQFDTLDGKPPHTPADVARDAPRRVFSISAQPLLAVLGQEATVARCAAVGRFAQLPWRDPVAGRRLVEQVDAIAIAARTRKALRVAITCIDETVQPAATCDGRRVLAALDWAHLGNVDLGRARIEHGKPMLQFFGDDWTIAVTGADPIVSLHLVRRYPAPF